MSEGSFHRVISEHLALARRNKRLERSMPLDGYRERYDRGLADDPQLVGAQAGDEPPSETDIPTPPLRRDPDSWWEASEERPRPAAFDWGDD